MDKHISYTKQGLLQIIDSLPLAISVIDKDRRVALANKAVLKFVNKREEQLIGNVGGEAFECINAFDVPDGCGFGPQCFKCDLRKTVVDTLQNRVHHGMVEMSMSFKTRGRLHLRVTTQPITFENEDVVLLTIEDITQAVAHEKTRLEKEKLKAAMETAGAICHELNQPLQAALSVLEMLIIDPETGDQNNTLIKRVLTEILRMGGITKKLQSIVSYKTKEYVDGVKVLDIDKSTQK